MEVKEKEILIAEEIRGALKTTFESEKQVIVHCCFPSTPHWGNLIRIWPSTFLLDKNSNHKSKLIHVENISMYPMWTEIMPNRDYWFTLVFSGLPKQCKEFTFKEIIPQQGGFSVERIARNSTDVYRITLK